MAFTRKPSPEPRTDDTEPEVPGRDIGGTCNLAGCPYDAEVRGLCEAHWGTHRGLADPDVDAPAVELGPDVALP